MSNPPSTTVRPPRPPLNEATFHGRQELKEGDLIQKDSHQQSFEQWHQQRHSSYEEQASSHRRAAYGSANGSDKRSGPKMARRWSFLLQDIPRIVSRSLNSFRFGYAARLACFVAVAGGSGYGFYQGVLVRSQADKPLAKRWWLCSPAVPITLVERRQIDESNMYYYRFSLPHAYDYAGYDPISSVQICSGKVGGLSSLQRWYTPISHPEERGFIEFVIKDCDPGRMSARIRSLRIGDQAYLGRWMKEFRFDPQKHRDLGIICSTGGASIALQLINYLDRRPMIPTRVSLLYCHNSPIGIPFRKEFQEYAFQDSRFSVFFNASGIGIDRFRNPQAMSTEGLELDKNLFLGNISPQTVLKAMPPPIKKVDSGSLLNGSETYRPSILICGPQSMLTFLCGKVSTIGHTTYWQGPFYKFYTGFLSDLGYTREQVYKFGVSKHFMAIQ